MGPPIICGPNIFRNFAPTNNIINMKKLYLLLTIAYLSTFAVAQEKFELGKPNNDAYRYLDSVTHIDGIGTQMHISCFKNSTTQYNLKRAITGNIARRTALRPLHRQRQKGRD